MPVMNDFIHCAALDLCACRRPHCCLRDLDASLLTRYGKELTLGCHIEQLMSAHNLAGTTSSARSALLPYLGSLLIRCGYCDQQPRFFCTDCRPCLVVEATSNNELPATWFSPRGARSESGGSGAPGLICSRSWENRCRFHRRARMGRGALVCGSCCLAKPLSDLFSLVSPVINIVLILNPPNLCLTLIR